MPKHFSDVYANALRNWLVDNPHSFAKPKVEDLVVNYPHEERENLKRCYDRAIKDPDECTAATVTSISPTASQLKSTLSHHSCQVIEDQQKEIVELRRKTEEMKLALEEKDLDIIEQQKRKEFETKRNEMALRKKQAELETYKDMVEDANSILDVHDFNRVRSTYAKSAICGVASVCPTGGPETKKPPGGPLLNFNNTLEPQNEFRNSTRSNLYFPGVLTKKTEIHEPEVDGSIVGSVAQWFGASFLRRP